MGIRGEDPKDLGKGLVDLGRGLVGVCAGHSRDCGGAPWVWRGGLVGLQLGGAAPSGAEPP